MAFDFKAYQRAYRATPRGKESARRGAAKYSASAKGRAYQQAYYESGKRKAVTRRYAVSYRGALRSALRRAEVRHKERWPSDPTSLTHADVIALWRQQSGRCALSGLELTWGQGTARSTSLSIDRIDARRGYHLDNIRLVCHAINAFRGNGTDTEMLEIAKAIIAYAARSTPTTTMKE